MQENNVNAKTKTYWYYLIVVLILVALFSTVYYFQKVQKQKVQKQKDLLNQLPDYLLPQDGKTQLFKPKSAEGYYLLKNQSLNEEGITYQINKNLNESAKQVWGELQNDGWIAIGGSNQGEGFKIYKVAKEGQGNLFIRLEKLGENLTQVKIINVKINK